MSENRTDLGKVYVYSWQSKKQNRYTYKSASDGYLTTVKNKRYFCFFGFLFILGFAEKQLNKNMFARTKKTLRELNW